jgi:hypothetical protein
MIEHVETNARVAVAPDLVTRFRWRAERRARDLNAQLRVPFYRWAVRREGGRWAVVALQNVARSRR